MNAYGSSAALTHLLEFLRCPETGERLQHASAESLTTTETGRQWPVVEGRPVFIPAGREVRRMPDEHLSNAITEDAETLIREARDRPVLNLSAGGTADELPNVVEKEDIVVGVLAVPTEAAQAVADDLVTAGVRIIFNYSEALLQVPPEVTVHTSSPAVDLLYALYFYLT